jgi:hypothetical protein
MLLVLGVFRVDLALLVDREARYSRAAVLGNLHLPTSSR